MEKKLLDMMNQLFISEYNSRVEYGDKFQVVVFAHNMGLAGLPAIFPMSSM